MARKSVRVPAKSKSEGAAPATTTLNLYSAISKMTGNPNSPAEFDASPHDDDELFFKADEDTSELDKKKIPLLNFIHKDLHQNIARKIPANDSPHFEIYHRATFQGVELDVCVYFPPPQNENGKECYAMVKVVEDDLSSEESAPIYIDAMFNADAKADSFTEKNATLTKNYWAPRWKYVVNLLRDTAYKHYDQNGVYNPPPEPEVDAPSDVDTGSQEETEEEMQVFSGATGKIIGPKGSKIQEIKAASVVTDIKMPAKNEDGSRPKARELVIITITGKPRAIAKAKKLIQEVVDEWVNAPRPPRDDGYTQSAPTGGDATGNFSAGFGDNAGDGSNRDAGVGSTAKAGGETGGASESWGRDKAGAW